jgi:hypothetical protein
VGDANPLCAVQDALNLHGFDEIIISTLPWRASQWLRVDLPRKVRALGVPVVHVQSLPPAPKAFETEAPTRARVAAQTRPGDDPLIPDLA